jgi:hypothetical protein
MPSIFSVFTRVGRLPAPMRANLEPEGIIAVAERVGVRQRFSGSVPGMVSSWGANRHTGVLVLTRTRIYALLPTVPRLKGPAIDACWDAADEGPAQVTINEAGLKMELEVNRVDPRFHGHLSLDYRTPLSDDVLAALPKRSLNIGVTPEYVFHMLGVRVR